MSDLQRWLEPLLYCALLNYSLLLLWFVLLVTARQRIYRLHARLIPISEPQFLAAHYAGMVFYKLAILLLFLTPYIAILLIT